MQKITQADINNYKARGRTECPICQSDDIATSASGFTPEGTLFRLHKCYKCQAEWKEYFKLSNIEIRNKDGTYGPKEKIVMKFWNVSWRAIYKKKHHMAPTAEMALEEILDSLDWDNYYARAEALKIEECIDEEEKKHIQNT